VFAIDQHTLEISSTTGGSVISPGEGEFVYTYGEKVTLEAEAEPGYHFTQWLGSFSTRQNPATITMNNDYYTQAIFAEDEQTFGLTISSSQGGSVTEPGEGDFEYPDITIVMVQAIEDPDFQFARWSGTAVDASKVANPNTANTQVTVDAQYTLHAQFDPSEVQQTFSLTISSSEGGSVTVPGEGDFEYPVITIVTVQAVEAPNFEFAGWSGTAVAAGKVANPSAANTQVTVDAHYTLHAQFESAEPPAPVAYDIYYVDDDALNDTGPNDSALSDTAEDGSFEHPFDMIQEGIDKAEDGNSVVVLPGIYFENINLQGKQIMVTALDGDNSNHVGINANAVTTLYAENSNQAGLIANTVIDGNDTGTVVIFDSGEDANCILSGFTITRGYADIGGGIKCYDSSPTIKNCIIVGNRAYRYNGGAVDSYQSAAIFENCTISGNYARRGGGAINCEESNVVFVNCILWDNTPDQILVTSGNDPVVKYSDVAGGSTGQGNINQDPCFADPGYWADSQNPNMPIAPSSTNAIWIDGDYHLMSCQGRFDPDTATWAKDSVDSPCIDTGDPSLDYSLEPAPNGDCINMGAYGGTAQASKSTLRKTSFVQFNLDTDPGWPVEGDWAFGTPQGAGGANGNPDTNVGYTGVNVYGVNLAGDYRVMVGGPYYLTAGPFDCTERQAVSVRFARWLNSDFYPFVGNTLEVSNDGQTWSVVWQAQEGENLADSEWQILEYDISAVADGQGSVYLRWGYEIISDRAYPYSGWNIDDIELRGL
jgi:predicted outer membrane repeat protein